MPTLGQAFVVIRASLKPLAGGLRKAFSMVRGTMRSIARHIKRAAMVIVGALTGAVVAAAKFQQQMAMVSTMLDQKTMPLMEGLSKTVLDLSKKYGQATATLTKGLYDILSASISASVAPKVLETSARAAIAGMTETGVAADLFTTLINAYAMDVSRAGEISDKVFATVKRGKTTFAEIASSIGRAASTAAIAGMRFEELLALLATLTRAGISTFEAMTSINGVLRAFLKPAKEAKDVAAKFGVELSSDTLKTIGFIGAVKKLNKASAEQLASIIPNIRAFKAMAGALKNLEGFNYDLAFISEQSAGRTAEAYKKMASNVTLSGKRLWQQIKSTFVALGEPLLGTVNKLFGLTGAMFSKLEGWLKDNSTTITAWAETAFDAFTKIINKVGEYVAAIKAGVYQFIIEDLGGQLKKAFTIAWDFATKSFLPVAKQIGRALADAISDHLQEKHPILFGTGRAIAWPIETLSENITKAAIRMGAAGTITGRTRAQTAELLMPQGERGMASAESILRNIERRLVEQEQVGRIRD